MKKNALFIALSLALASGCTNLSVTAPDTPAEDKLDTASASPAAPATASAARAKDTHAQECTPQANTYYINDKGRKTDMVRIRATGYGAPPKAFYSDPQRRLMAMRAAKIDAYRNLAERVKGIQIWGGTTVGDMVIEKDRFRVYLDTYLVGAKVIAESPNEDGSFETVVELKVSNRFLDTALGRPGDECAPAAQQLTHEARPEEPHQLDKESSKELAQSDFYFDKE